MQNEVFMKSRKGGITKAARERFSFLESGKIVSRKWDFGWAVVRGSSVAIFHSFERARQFVYPDAK